MNGSSPPSTYTAALLVKSLKTRDCVRSGLERRQRCRLRFMSQQIVGKKRQGDAHESKSETLIFV